MCDNSKTYYESLHAPGKKMWDDVQKWLDEGAKTPDPRGTPPSLNHVYDYTCLQWLKFN